MKVIIVDDEPLARSIVKKYLQSIPGAELVAECNDGFEGIKAIQQLQPDLIFLDIHLPKLKGMAFLKTLTHPPAVIITTAYHQYAVEGFDLNVTDYLLKPFEFERFLVAVNKAKTQNRPEMVPTPSKEEKDHLFLNVQKKKVKLLFSDIVYIESQREYIRIVTTKKEYLSKMSTHEIEALLPARLFRRVHRSFIISVEKIDSYTAEMVEVGGVSIPIGRGYRDVMEGW